MSLFECQVFLCASLFECQVFLWASLFECRVFMQSFCNGRTVSVRRDV